MAHVMSKASGHSPATEPQVRFIKSLLEKHRVDDEHAHWILCQIEAGELSKRQASIEIDVIKAKPMRAKVEHAPYEVAPKAEVALGYYTDGESVFQIVESKAGNKYVKVLVVKSGQEKPKGTWQYVPGGMKFVSNWTALTVEEAAGMGQITGVCMICGRTLTKTESIEAGIGPVCAGKL